MVCYLRKGDDTDPVLLVICHFNANTMEDYRVGVPYGGKWTEVLNSDDKAFGGSGISNGAVTAKKEDMHGQEYSVGFTLPPLAVMVFEGGKPPKKKTTEVKETAVKKSDTAKKKKAK